MDSELQDSTKKMLWEMVVTPVNWTLKDDRTHFIYF